MHYLWRIKDIVLQHITRTDLSLIGSFHYGNVGDMAIGRAVKDITPESISTGYYLLGKNETIRGMYPEHRNALVCGGGLGRNKFFERFNSEFEGTDFSIIGISLWYDLNITHKVEKILEEAEQLTVRNKRDKEYLSERSIEAKYVPDTAFALTFENSTTKNRVGLNVQSGHINRYDSEEYEKKYKKIFKKVSKNYLNKGVEVVHVPFTKSDELLSEKIFGDMDVKKITYQPDVKKMYKTVSSCKCFIGTRFHSHVFSLKAGVPLFSFRYAPKCEYLFDDLDLDKNYQFDKNDVVNEESEIVEFLSYSDGCVLGSGKISKIESSVASNITSGIESIF